MNKCNLIKKGISVLLSVDTPKSEIMKIYAGHLKECDDCLDYLSKGVPDFKIVEDPDEDLLHKARMELREELYKLKYKEKESVLNKLTKFFRTTVFGYGFAPVLSLIIGIFIGKMVFGTPGVTISNIPLKDNRLISRGDFEVKNLLVSIDKDVSKVDLNFEIAREVSISGDADNLEVINFLTYALKQPISVGKKLKCIKLLKDRRENIVKSALTFVALYDNNPGVRLEAVKNLRNFKLDEELTGTYLEILRKERNPAIKVESIKALKHSKNKDVFAVLADNILKEKNTYIKYLIKQVIEKYGQKLLNQSS